MAYSCLKPWIDGLCWYWIGMRSSRGAGSQGVPWGTRGARGLPICKTPKLWLQAGRQATQLLYENPTFSTTSRQFSSSFGFQKHILFALSFKTLAMHMWGMCPLISLLYGEECRVDTYNYYLAKNCAYKCYSRSKVCVLCRLVSGWWLIADQTIREITYLPPSASYHQYSDHPGFALSYNIHLLYIFFLPFQVHISPTRQEYSDLY